MAGAAPPLRADDVAYRYDGDILPFDPAAGWEIFNDCELAKGCVKRIENGHFVLEWSMGRDVVNFHHKFTALPGDFWVEWEFRSNRPFIPTQPGCDGIFVVGNSYDVIWMHGDRVRTAAGDAGLAPLPLDEFHSYRFERRVGDTFTFSVNGHVFVSKPDDASDIIGFVQMLGLGSCSGTGDQRNMWDHVWYGTMSDGQTIVAASPPAGLVDANAFPDVDRFTVTFDEPAFVHVGGVTVEQLSPIASGAPGILWTRRLINGEPDTVEIVLDQPLALGTTTRFTFDTGGAAMNVVEYTYLPLGACCLAHDSCMQTEEADCADLGGLFTPGENCPGPQPCCFDGLCDQLDPACCAAFGGASGTSTDACETDVDGDGTDALCGDQCPMDPNKLDPGICGCGVSDFDSDNDTVADCLDVCPGEIDTIDTDGDTVPDCLDQCPGEDDNLDEDGNNVPDCLQFQPIPTTTAWGLAVLALLLLIAAKLTFSRRRRPGTVFLCLAAVALAGGASANAATLYVTTSGGGDCSSWANACTLSAAHTAADSGDEIWVQAGTYGPLALKNAVKIIGGFDGTESAASESDPAANLTTVDGSGQYQCVTGNGVGPTTVLRGFTIRNCSISGTDPMGAGIYLEASSALIVQCIIENNQAEYFGAGAAVKGPGTPEFINCIFRNNGSGEGESARPYGGGAFWAYSGSPKFTNCLFHGNVAWEGAGAIVFLSTPTFINCTFTDNRAEIGSGGGIHDGNGDATIHNSIVWNNSSARTGSDIYSKPSRKTPTTYSDVQGGWPGTGNIDSDPAFTNPAADDFTIPDTSPCKDAGSNTLLPADVADLDWDANTTESIPKDLKLDARKIPFVVDMGAYEAKTDPDPE